MFVRFLKQLFGRPTQAKGGKKNVELIDEAVRLSRMGNPRAAVRLFREYLETDPYNVSVLNDLGVCLSDIADNDGADAAFRLAYSLDDTCLPAIVNHAKLLLEQDDAAEALTHLERAWLADPRFAHTQTVYAGLQLKLGNAARARAHQKKAWLANFESLRAADCHLFWMGYDDVDEATLAAEHRFWAETLRPLPGLEGPPRPHQISSDWKHGKIRVGYWSPDLRNHSVRYFFRPLLENHDSDRFSVYLYHDFPLQDAQTELMKAKADVFRPVHHLTDAELIELMRNDELDVLVELAGHTSANRLTLLQSRLAPIQLTGIGYPPTTGLTSLDGKLLDRHLMTPGAERFYAERPLVLPNAFWCFDPMEPSTITPDPPMRRQGFITFGAVGNVAKITRPIAQAWREILAQVPGSRLLVRSISFNDAASIEASRERLGAWGLPLDRLDLALPRGGRELFESYNEIDIILDTFPFNGGTTSCFATYMGVPVVTLVGQSVIGRMGLSILSNLRWDELACDDVHSYVACAVRIANDPDRLARYRRDARRLFRETPLGNGLLFARELEAALIGMLEALEASSPPWQSRIAALPAAEIAGRGYTTLASGQLEAAIRIADYCLREHPDAAEGYLLQAQIFSSCDKSEQAKALLSESVTRLPPDQQVGAWISLIRLQLLHGEEDAARKACAVLKELPVKDAFDSAYVRAYRAALAPIESRDVVGPVAAGLRVRVVCLCESPAVFESAKQRLLKTCTVPADWQLSVEYCPYADRATRYADLVTDGSADVLVLMHGEVEAVHPSFLLRAVGALDEVDIVGFAGVRRWIRMDWRHDEFEQKAAGFLAPSSEREELVDFHLIGQGLQELQTGMAVLDGSLLVLRRPKELPAPVFDIKLSQVGALMEEAWTHDAAKAGWKLGVHRNLGVFVGPPPEPELDTSIEARLHLNAARGFDPFGHLEFDRNSVSVPCADRARAQAVSDTFFQLRD